MEYGSTINYVYLYFILTLYILCKTLKKCVNKLAAIYSNRFSKKSHGFSRNYEIQ